MSHFDKALKDAVASSVFEVLKDAPFARAFEELEDVDYIDVQEPDGLSNTLRVVTRTHGIFYYEVRVKQTL